MTLIQVRAALAATRKQWNTSSPQQPMFISRPVNDKINIGEFCTRFKYYHHWKRHTKSANCKNSAGGAAMFADGEELMQAASDEASEDEDSETKSPVAAATASEIAGSRSAAFAAAFSNEAAPAPVLPLLAPVRTRSKPAPKRKRTAE